MVQMKKIMKVLLCIGLAAVVSLAPFSGLNTKAAPIATGIDVSVYQGDINWQAVAASGVSFAFVRVGTTYKGVDTKFHQNITGAAAAGLRTGAYIYSYATTPEAAAQEANAVLSLIAPYTVSFPVVIDIEAQVQKSLPPDQLAAIANTFCGIVQGAGYYPMVYASKNWFTGRIGEIGYDKWVAQYGPACEYPNPAIWQYSSTGSVGGINGNVDMNLLYKDYASHIIPGGFVNRNGHTYYYNNYRMQMGWAEIEGGKYFFNPAGEMQTGWISNGLISYYFQPNGLMQVGFADLDGSRYYFDDAGLMQTGLIDVGGSKYFFSNEGKMQIGWIDTGASKFYFNPDGIMVTGWSDIDGKRYYFKETGEAAVGLTVLDGKTYLFEADGSMKMGWVGEAPAKYYFLSDGSMAAGWQAIDGAMYFFKGDGTMNIGLLEQPNGKYYNDVDGKMVTGWKLVGDKWFYFGGDGIMAANIVADINGIVCQFDEYGVLVAPAGYVPAP